jgi:heme/copper-type cytochrome/quinol oxidase subunit 2
VAPSLILMASADTTENAAAPPAARLKWLNWSALLLAFIQSVCSAFIALSSIRLFIGAAAFASAIGLVKIADKLHIDAIRIPMMVIAFVGSVVNLLALWQLWRLRRRSASGWRQKPVTPRQKRSERIQFSLSVITLLLLAAEFWAHWKLFGSQ